MLQLAQALDLCHHTLHRRSTAHARLAQKLECHHLPGDTVAGLTHKAEASFPQHGPHYVTADRRCAKQAVHLFVATTTTGAGAIARGAVAFRSLLLLLQQTPRAASWVLEATALAQEQNLAVIDARNVVDLNAVSVEDSASGRYKLQPVASGI